METNASTRPLKRQRQKPLTPTLKSFQSAITNGSDLLHDLDHRSAWARRFRDLLRAHISDLGGDDNLSQAEQSLCRRASMLTLQLELLEQRFADNNGEATSAQLGDYQRAANSLRRILESLGLQRRAVDVTRRECEDREAGLVP
jgi:hypothetical protein